MPRLNNFLYAAPPPFEIYRELSDPHHESITTFRNNVVDYMLDRLPRQYEAMSKLFVPGGVPASPSDNPGITLERLQRVVILSQRHVPGDYIANLSTGTKASALGAALLSVLHDTKDNERIVATPDEPYLSLEGDKLMFGVSFSQNENIMNSFRRTQATLRFLVDTTVVETKPNLIMGVMGGASGGTKRLAEEAFRNFEGDYVSLGLTLEPISVAGKIFDLARRKTDKPGRD